MVLVNYHFLSALTFTYRWICSIPYFLHHGISHFTSSKSFQTGCSLFVIPTRNVSHSKQAAINVLIPAIILPAYFLLPWSMSSESFLDIILYIKPLLYINKEFSIDSFLDWEGHRWGISLTTYHFRTSVSVLTPLTHHTCYMNLTCQNDCNLLCCHL